MGRRLDAVLLAVSGVTISSLPTLQRVLAAWQSSLDRPTMLSVTVRNGHFEATISSPIPAGEDQTAHREFLLELMRVLQDARSTRGNQPITTAASQFSSPEIHALAAAYQSRASVQALFHAAHLRPEIFLSFDSAPNAEIFWSEVAWELAMGKDPGGRQRLLTAAAAEYPGNPAFEGRRDPDYTAGGT